MVGYPSDSWNCILFELTADRAHPTQVLEPAICILYSHLPSYIAETVRDIIEAKFQRTTNGNYDTMVDMTSV